MVNSQKNQINIILVVIATTNNNHNILKTYTLAGYGKLININMMVSSQKN